MSKSTSIKAAEKSSAIATTDDPLEGMELETDGLEEVDSGDVSLARLVWNCNSTTPEGEPIPPNRFLNSVTEEVSTVANLSLLTLHKSREWKEYDVDAGRTDTFCSSWDTVTGTMEDGTPRPCEGCPDARWAKAGPRCSEVANVVAVDLDSGQPVRLEFKRTSARPWKSYLNRSVLGRRFVGGKRTHMPLFAHPTTITLKMAEGAKNPYAVPVLTRADDPFCRADILYFAESAKAFREMQATPPREQAPAATSLPADVDAALDGGGFDDEPAGGKGFGG